MGAKQPAPDDQAALWNGPAGLAWVETQELMDQTLKPFEDLLVEAVSAARPRRVLDVGCGTGSTTLAFARALGAGGRCVGVDISEPMIAARSRTRRARACAGRLHLRRRADARVRARELRHDRLALRRDVLRRSRARVREPAACRARRRRAPAHRVAQCRRRIRS